MGVTLLEREQKKTVQFTRAHEKRYFPRWEVNKRVEYTEEGGAAFLSYTRDLSLDGASVFVFGNPPAGQRLQLKIHLADKESFETQGRVAWIKSEPTHKLIGITFESLGKKAQALIMRHAFELKEDDLLIYRLIKKFTANKVFLSPEIPLSTSNAIPSVAERASGDFNEGAVKRAGHRWLWKERGKR